VLLSIQIQSLNALRVSFWEKLINSSIDFENENYETQEHYFISFFNSVNISRECESRILDTLKALKNLEDWSFKMYNSWGKFPPSGILDGTVTDFGDYDQCLAIKPNEVIGKSQYCLIDISFQLPKMKKVYSSKFLP
jgi:hypothetical protein